MTKLFKTILAALLILTGLSTAGLCLAAPFYNSDLETRITLDPNMKPANAPGAIISQDSLQAQGSEAYFANYMLQVLAGGLITVAAPVAIIIIAIGGLFAVVSHGNTGLMEKAKKTVTWAVIGLIIIIFSWVIIRTTISIVITTNSNQPGAAGAPAAQSPAAQQGKDAAGTTGP